MVSVGFDGVGGLISQLAMVVEIGQLGSLHDQREPVGSLTTLLFCSEMWRTLPMSSSFFFAF